MQDVIFLRWNKFKTNIKKIYIYDILGILSKIFTLN